MDGREIPGYYFDPDKKKYFKIQKAYHAPRPGSKYSQDNVRNEQKKEKAEKEAATRTKKRQKETVVRRYAQDTLMHASLDREIGMKRVSYYRQNVWPGACISKLQNIPQGVVQRPEHSSIRYFDRDPVSKTLYAVHKDNKIKRRQINPPNGVPLPTADLDLEFYTERNPLSEYSFQPWDELARLTSSISSLVYLPASGALAATTYGGDRPPVVYLSDPDIDGPYVNQQFTPKNTSTIWGVAARPTRFSPSSTATDSNSIAAADTECLAVAASSSLLHFTRSQAGSWDSTTALQSDADIIALDWLSHTIIALGCRNGKIRLYDTRSKGSSHILTHPCSVSQIRRADDLTRLVCAGLQDTLYLYDIRSPKLSQSSSFKNTDHHYNKQFFKDLYPGDRNRKKRRKMNHVAFHEWSQPIISFQHSNPDDLHLDIDVHSRLGLVAAAQDHSTSRSAIRVYNMWTGKMVKALPRIGGNLGSAGSSISCLKFMDDGDSGEISLWSTWQGGVNRFRW